MRLQTTARTSSLSESFKTALQFYSSEYSGDGCDLVFKEQPKENMNDATSPPRTTQIERDDYNKEESLQSWIKRQARKRSVDEIVVMAGNVQRGSEILVRFVFKERFWVPFVN
jgi:hypothetical protein